MKQNIPNKGIRPQKMNANKVKKEDMLKEANMQEIALTKIKKWLGSSVVIFVLSLIFVYCGLYLHTLPHFIGIIAIVASIVFGFISIMILLAVINGTKNINKIKKLAKDKKD